VSVCVRRLAWVIIPAYACDVAAGLGQVRVLAHLEPRTLLATARALALVVLLLLLLLGLEEVEEGVDVDLYGREWEM
jgi:hypothetical protein